MGMGKSIKGSKDYWRDSYLVESCKEKKVLHVGCTDYPFFKEAYKTGSLLHEKVTQVADKVVGVDIAKEDVIAMQNLGYDVRLIDAQKMSEYDWEEKFDIVLLADVIEHISNPGLVIKEAGKLLNKQGRIIISVPNAFGIVRFLKSFFRYEQVHPDHIAYYSSGTLETLARNLDLDVVELAWYRFEVRDPRLIVRFSALLERIVTVFFPWQAEGCIAVLKPSPKFE